MGIRFKGCIFGIVILILCSGTIFAANNENPGLYPSNQIRLINNDNGFKGGIIKVTDINKIQHEFDMYESILNRLTDVFITADYKIYPLIDRKLITSPSMIEFLHRGWGDFGFRSC
jgi:hypothetical protein